VTALVLDAGAFIAWERGDRTIRAHLEAARRLGLTLLTTSPVIAQVWREGSRQALLARLIKSVDVAAPTLADAQRAGELCRITRTTDVVDALLVIASPIASTVLTSDPADITALVEAAQSRLIITKI
jgi:hypothetical protein